MSDTITIPITEYNRLILTLFRYSFGDNYLFSQAECSELITKHWGILSDGVKSQIKYNINRDIYELGLVTNPDVIKMWKPVLKLQIGNKNDE